MPYIQNEKIPNLDTLTPDASDYTVYGDVSDSGRAKKVLMSVFGSFISTFINISNIVTGILGPANGGTGIDGSTAVKGDLIVGSGPGTFALENVGTDGQVLTADNSFPNGVKWSFPTGGNGGGGGTKLAIDTTEVTVGSATVDIFTVVIPGGTLGTNDAIRFKVIGSEWDAGQMTVNVKYGGSTVATVVQNPVANNQLGDIEGYILADGAINVQKAFVKLSTTPSTGTQNNLEGDIGYGTGAVDSSIAQNLVIEVVNVSGSKVFEAIIVEQITSASGSVTNVTVFDDFTSWNVVDDGANQYGVSGNFFGIRGLVAADIFANLDHPGAIRLDTSGQFISGFSFGGSFTTRPIVGYLSADNDFDIIYLTKKNDTGFSGSVDFIYILDPLNVSVTISEPSSVVSYNDGSGSTPTAVPVPANEVWFTIRFKYTSGTLTIYLNDTILFTGAVALTGGFCVNGELGLAGGTSTMWFDYVKTNYVVDR